MVIRASASRQIDALIANLAELNPVIRDAAVARLTVIGPRAVGRLTSLARDRQANAGARLAALKTLEAIPDARAFEPAAELTSDENPVVSAAAIGLLRSFVEGGLGVTAIDRLTGIVLDKGRPDATRLAALAALADLDQATIKPLLDALRDDPSRALASAAKDTPARPAADGPHVLVAVSEGRIPEDPARVSKALTAAGDSIDLPILLGVIERVRDHEERAKGSRRVAWLGVRGAAHAALARRGSRVALYDLRETLQRTPGALPVDFLAALTAIGDASFLEAIAASHARAATAGETEDWWRRHLADAFKTIVSREGLTRRSAPAKTIEKRWPGALATLWP